MLTLLIFCLSFSVPNCLVFSRPNVSMQIQILLILLVSNMYNGNIATFWHKTLYMKTYTAAVYPSEFCNIFRLISNVKIVFLTFISSRNWRFCCTSSNCAGGSEFCLKLFMVCFLLKLNETFYWQNLVKNGRVLVQPMNIIIHFECHIPKNVFWLQKDLCLAWSKMK